MHALTKRLVCMATTTVAWLVEAHRSNAQGRLQCLPFFFHNDGVADAE